jgi:serine/threonine-protein kinase
MFDFGQTTDGRLFMTMEFLDGISLRDATAKGALAPQRVVKILIQCCASLAEAHSIGIIHRDIKPDNVFLLNMAGSPDFVKLLDFSVAKLLQEGDKMHTQAGVVFGTPQYMSPEQGRGLPLDARSDLYALGILAFEMLTGMVPFHDDNPMTVIQMHLRAEIPPMPQNVPYSVQQIVRRALEKDAARRYQSAGEMMQHCQQVFAELNAGNVSMGGGGVPRTIVAPLSQMMPPGQGGPQMLQPQPIQPPPQAQGGLQQQQPGFVGASAAAKTMIAQVSPFTPGQPQQPPGQMQPQMQPSGFQQANPMQKTIVAGMAPQIQGGQFVPQQNMQAGGPGGMMQPQPSPGGGGPNKTILLQPTDGIVSVAAAGGPVSAQAMPMQGGAPQSGPAGQVIQGASTAFWIMSLIVGIAVGALAYVIVLQM